MDDIRLSSIHETAYLGPAGPQPPFLNAALVGRTTLPARELLRALLDIERAFGRTRPYQDAPRPIDLDLILYGASVIDQPGLVVPHPRFRQRRFVLEPLAEVAADWLDPVSGRRSRNCCACSIPEWALISLFCWTESRARWSQWFRSCR